MDMRNNYNHSPNMRERGERGRERGGERGDREYRNKPRDNTRPHQSRERGEANRNRNPNAHRAGSGRRNDNYAKPNVNGEPSRPSGNGSRRNVNRPEGNSPPNNYYAKGGKSDVNPDYPPIPTAYNKDNAYKQFNGSNSSLNSNNSNIKNRNNSSSSVNLISTPKLASSQPFLAASPFQNSYKPAETNSNTDNLEKYTKLNRISPIKFYISIGCSLLITIGILVVGIYALINGGLSAKSIYDINTGIAQGYVFYVGFMVIAVATGIYSFIKKWNSLLVTYCSFLCVSVLYLGYFIIDLGNISRNSVEVMEIRWKNEFTDYQKLVIQNNYDCCGFLTAYDDSVISDDCVSDTSVRKRDLYSDNNMTSSLFMTPNKFNSSKLSKRLIAEENGGCAFPVTNIISKNLKIYIIIFVVLIIINIIAAVLTFLNIKEYAEIISELSNPFA